ncbi:hypothetical protein HOF78_02020 [Candidatus Woesearchaeota archaeon]|jgi:hypothetical protein|nr:hypothetical protein [Candidatus Woesearchaeota archaeon]MBT6044694.1 hypothetical protein [Candidatus Woesearchaeota archaeon]
MAKTEKMKIRVEETDLVYQIDKKKHIPITKLIADDCGRDVPFVYPFNDWETYADAFNTLNCEHFDPPTMSEMVSFVHCILESTDNSYRGDVEKLMKKYGFWGFTGSLFLPSDGKDVNNGVLIQDHPEIKDGMPFMDRDNLVKKLQANDPSVRFVPFGFATSLVTPVQLSNNPYICGLVGEENAEKLAEIAGRLKKKTYLRELNFSADKPLTLVSSLSYSRFFGGPRLIVGGDEGNLAHLSVGIIKSN